MSLLRIVQGAVVVSTLSFSLFLPAAAEFADEGATGTLTIKVKVEGAGRIDSEGPGWEYYNWRVGNQESLRFTLTAMGPSMDAGQFAGLSGGGDDSDWEAAYDDRFDACDGDAACEMRVTRERTQDPRARRLRIPPRR